MRTVLALTVMTCFTRKSIHHDRFMKSTHLKYNYAKYKRDL